jgi:Putative DNA-binding domain
MKLAQLQSSFQDHLLRGTGTLLAQVVGDARAAAAPRLQAYTGAYLARLVEVLAESFPAVQASLGAAGFARLAADFIRHRPSRVRSARDYGAELPQWLLDAGTGPRRRRIADLARFEWAVAGAFDAADEPALTPASLAGVAPVDWPQLRFGFTPSLRRVQVTSNAVGWWRFACAGTPRPRRWRTTCPQHWLVWRRDLAVLYRRMSRAETLAVDAARAGATFGQLCGDRNAVQAATMLHGWFTAGLVTRAEVGIS